MSKKIKFQNREVESVFQNYPAKMRSRLLLLRSMIFEIASKTEGVGELEETLKWGSPSYLTTQTGSGTTLRIDRLSSQPRKFAMCVHCQTTLVGPFKEIYGDEFTYDANRGIILDQDEELPVEAIGRFISMALTYHARKKSNVSTFKSKGR